MNRGPKPGSRRRDERTFVEKATDAWGVVPDWVQVLAEFADANTASLAAVRIGYSGSYISNAILNKFPGDIIAFEAAVRGALQGVSVSCPVLGVIGRERCASEQRKPARATNSSSLQLHAACRNGCPNYRGARS